MADEVVETQEQPSDETVVTEPTETQDDTVTEDSATEGAPQDESSEESSENPDTPVEPGEGQEIYNYDGVEMAVDVPEDLRQLLSGKGIDVDKVVKELYDGEFGLTGKTRATLDNVYGKTIVDGYLEGLKARNDMAAKTYKEALSEAEKSNAQAWSETLGQVGGEQNWKTLESWALETWDDATLQEFNTVMESNSRYAQRLAIDDLLQKYKESEGDGKVALIESDGTEDGDIGGPLSADEYQDLFTTKEYYNDPEGYDARRRLGQKQGI